MQLRVHQASFQMPTSKNTLTLTARQSGKHVYTIRNADIVDRPLTPPTEDSWCALKLIASVYANQNLPYSLAVQLFEFTTDKKYLSSAKAASEFVRWHMYDGQAIADTVRLTATGCEPSHSHRSSTAGLVVRALAMLAQHDAGDGSLCVARVIYIPGSMWRAHEGRLIVHSLDSLIFAAVPLPTWTNPSNGIVIEGTSYVNIKTVRTNPSRPNGYMLGADSVNNSAEANSMQCSKGENSILDDGCVPYMLIACAAVWIRGLSEALLRKNITSDTAQYLQNYIYVQVNTSHPRTDTPPEFGLSFLLPSAQYNALVNRATIRGTNLYSLQWEGPPVQKLSKWGQLTSLNLLSAGFAMLSTNDR